MRASAIEDTLRGIYAIC